MSDNTITLAGNVTRDPELRLTASGRCVTGFGLAANRRYQVNGDWKESTSFFDVVALGHARRERRRVAPQGRPHRRHRLRGPTELRNRRRRPTLQAGGHRG